MSRVTLTRLIGGYVIVEPTVRNTVQIVGGIVALLGGATVLGVVLIAWAVADLAIKATAGVCLLTRQTWRRQ